MNNIDLNSRRVIKFDQKSSPGSNSYVQIIKASQKYWNCIFMANSAR